MADLHRHPSYTSPTGQPGQTGLSPKAVKKENIRSILSTVAVLLVAPIIAILLTSFIFQSYQVDGESMETTLQHNDRLIVWKVPKTISRISGNAYIPNRGDVVVFTEPALDQFGQDPGKQLIKRVVGLPGEKVVVKDGTLTVYNDEHPKGFQPDQDLPYGDIIKTTNIEGSWLVGKNEIFVAGDNRTNSLDSRTFGPIDAHNIVGKLIARVLPISNAKSF
jgi:signal peptidase I